MLSPRWRKLCGDIDHGQGRLVMMVIAVGVGIFAVAAILSAYIILNRELDRGFLAANPATAYLKVNHLDADAIDAVRRLPGIAWAEAGGRIAGRVEVRAGTWLPLLLFVVADFSSMHLGRVSLETGRWPDSPRGIVIERTALALANTALNRELTVEMQNGRPRSLQVTGAVHDPGLAPAWQQQTIYGYVTPATLGQLSDTPALSELKLLVTDLAADPAVQQRIVLAVASWLTRAGYPVGEIRMPPRHHPHQSQMSGVTQMLLVFSVLALVLGAVLTATLTASLLAPQVRQIAVMKTLGARSAQIVGLYMTLIAGIALIATGVGLPLGIAGGRALARGAAEVLNIELASLGVSPWVYLGVFLAGVGVPLLLALIPIMRACRRTIRESLQGLSMIQPSAPAGPLARWTSALAARNPGLLLAIRNSVRNRLRFALTLGLLATAGAMFITSLNIKAAWARNLTDANAERHFDLEMHFVRPAAAAALVEAVSGPGVMRVEPFGEEPAAVARSDGFNLVSTYPDGDHGSLRLESVPGNGGFITPKLVEGHWFDASADGAVLNLQARAQFPGISLGDPIHLSVQGRPVTLHIVGIVREHLSGASVYIAAGESTNGIRIALDAKDEVATLQAAAAIEERLKSRGVTVARSVTRFQLGRGLAGHLFILIFVLLVMSSLMALVGLLGLGAAMATGVLERSREFAVLRAIGAPDAAVLRSVVAEGLLIGVLSAAAAWLMSVPLTVLVAKVVGTGTLGAVSPSALPLWLAFSLTGAAAASAYPAWQATKLTVREALTHY
jgi:putative ABC transport system permease protein